MKRVRAAAHAASLAVLVLALWAPVATAAPAPVEAGKAQAGQFSPSAGCGCHANLVEEWKLSMHAKALDDPLYTTKLAEADKATNGALGPFCKKCHGPAATMMGEIASGKLSEAGSEGVSCDFCHQVTGLAKGTIANTSHLVEPIGIKRAQIKDPKAPHPALYSALHEKAEFCGGCHNVDHPINGMHLEATYSEWKQSSYAKDGIVCQDCHMSAQAGVVGPSKGQAAGGAPERENIYHMSFVGGQVALGNAEAATAMLKSAATIELEVSDIATAGAPSPVKVTVTNSGAGHDLPTGLTEVREMWLEVYAEDAAGNKTEIGERKFGTILEDAKGNAPVELWEATKIKSDDRIPAKGSISEEYSFEMPTGTDVATVKAVLNYRSASEEFAKKAGVENPITEMAAATQVVYSSEDARVAATKQDANSGESTDTMNLLFAVAGLGLVGGLVALFLYRGRNIEG